MSVDSRIALPQAIAFAVGEIDRMQLVGELRPSPANERIRSVEGCLPQGEMNRRIERDANEGHGCDRNLRDRPGAAAVQLAWPRRVRIAGSEAVLPGARIPELPAGHDAVGELLHLFEIERQHG